jgi:hypothetical protein
MATPNEPNEQADDGGEAGEVYEGAQPADERGPADVEAGDGDGGD